MTPPWPPTIQLTLRLLARIVWSSDCAPGPGAPPGVYVSPLTNSTPSPGTKVSTVVVACVVGSASRVTGRTGSGERDRAGLRHAEDVGLGVAAVEPVAQQPRAAVREHVLEVAARRPRARRAGADGHERAQPARVVGVVMADGHVADRLARIGRRDVAEQRLGAVVVQGGLDHDDPVLLLDDHRLVPVALDQRAAGATARGVITSAAPSLMKPRWAKRHQPLGRARAAVGERAVEGRVDAVGEAEAGGGERSR